ncbi:MAG: PaaI family thioesterase [Flavobacteriaceae bacterium]
MTASLSEKEILERCNARKANTLMHTLDIEFVAVDGESLTAKMPVNSSVLQPDGVLHGGATAALIETVGSVAVFVFKDTSNLMVRGIELNANHLKGVRSGNVYATAKALHLGRTTQLWEIKVVDDQGQLISVGKLTTLTLEKPLQ